MSPLVFLLGADTASRHVSLPTAETPRAAVSIVSKLSQLFLLPESDTASRCASLLVAESLQVAVSVMSKPAMTDLPSSIPFGFQHVDWSILGFCRHTGRWSCGTDGRKCVWATCKRVSVRTAQLCWFREVPYVKFCIRIDTQLLQACLPAQV